MNGTTPGWVKLIAVLGLFFGIIGVIVGGWMFSPIIIAGLIVLLVAMRKTPPPG